MRIGIVGAGIAGLTAACALARDGHEVTILDQFERPSAVGAGLLLQPSGLQALSALGLDQEIIPLGERIDQLDGRTTTGQRVLELVYDHWRPGAFGLGLHRAALFACLYRAAKAAGVEFVAGAVIDHIDWGRRPRLMSSDGRLFGPFHLIVVADGAHSKLREKIVPDAQSKLYPWGALWVVRPDTKGVWRHQLVQRYASARVMIGVLPMGTLVNGSAAHRQVAVFWSIQNDTVAAWRLSGLHHWQEQVSQYWPEAASLLAGLDDGRQVQHATYRDVRAFPWSSGPVLMIGDAAHGTSPQLGQGANLAMIDGLELASAVRRHPDQTEAAIHDYVHRRRAHIRWYQAMASALTPAFQSNADWIAQLRDVFMHPMGKLPLARQFMLETLCGLAQPPRSPWQPP